MKFNYQARTRSGEVQSGVIEASNKDTAYDILKSHGLFVTTLDDSDVPFYSKKVKFFEIITRKDVVMFSRQIAIMFKSNVPLAESFHTIARQMRNAAFRDKITKIAEDVEGGTPLSKALAAYPKIFSTFYISMVRSGEMSGKLSDVFSYLADYLEKEYRFRSKIWGAMTYPAFISVFFVAVGVVMFVFVLPQLTGLFKDSGQELPWATKVVLAVSDFMQVYWWVVIVVAAGLAYGIYRILKTKSGKSFKDQNLVRLPLIGSFFRKTYLSRFALNLSTLISGGIPIAQALEITGEIVGNEVYKEIILKTRDEVKRGEAISSVLERYPNYITPLFYQMTVVGEKTGTLDSSLANIIEFYEADVDRALESFTKLLEPIIIIIIGVFVAIFVVAILLPLYSFGGGE